ncbi:hypothetical protein L798_13037 [Zootermopsis nevadensis]|uniref:Uncharacterized protein n=1 Tax=Zootermopsis nevadensis TaxID=136037 RepID=A0A067R2D4_ZOONE|nr:hypothetical protein L798_13037 [Zootermopsis nevadensis]
MGSTPLPQEVVSTVRDPERPLPPTSNVTSSFPICQGLHEFITFIGDTADGGGSTSWVRYAPSPTFTNTSRPILRHKTTKKCPSRETPPDNGPIYFPEAHFNTTSLLCLRTGFFSRPLTTKNFLCVSCFHHTGYTQNGNR